MSRLGGSTKRRKIAADRCRSRLCESSVGSLAETEQFRVLRLRRQSQAERNFGGVELKKKLVVGLDTFVFLDT